MYPRICHIGHVESALPLPSVELLAGLGFDSVLVSPVLDAQAQDDRLHELSEACADCGLAVLADINISDLGLDHTLVDAYPDCFSVHYEAEGESIDPRRPAPHKGRAHLRPCESAQPVVAWWSDVLARYTDHGVSGFRVSNPAAAGTPIWRALIGQTRARSNRHLLFIADTPGTNWSDLSALAPCGFDFTVSSLPWWDGRASWLVEEYEALSRIASPIAQVDSPDKLPPASKTVRCARLAIAGLYGGGVLVPASYLRPFAKDDADGLSRSVRELNALCAAQSASPKRLLKQTGAGANVTVLMRTDNCDTRYCNEAYVCFVNPDPTLVAEPGPETVAALGDFDVLEPVAALGEADSRPRLAPGEARLFRAARTAAIRRSPPLAEAESVAAAKQPRLVIANVSPVVDAGRYPAKRIVGERVEIEADIFGDGHPVIAADLLWRPQDEVNWRHAAMHRVANDRWQAKIELARIGFYCFAVEAWIDTYGSFVRDLVKKRDAGQTVALEMAEGLDIITAASRRACGQLAAALERVLEPFERLEPDDRLGLLLAPETLETMRRLDDRPFWARSHTCFIEAERKAARFASWYELFPRSQTDSPAHSGTLRSTIARLAAIRHMGFDVLYFPPIHPIGTTARKGRNNALQAQAGDPGSPYAIGSSAGGHTAIDPNLGTLEDFRALVTAASEYDIEIALDFAVQCSRDHPWLKEHPGWFAWRPDGSIHFAENPPKTYEDIVNIEFYTADAAPAAWLALRDVVLYWIDAGVRIFRVDNPHTKPFPFWEWLIADVRARHPNVIFLSEAFTRPSVMYHLAKLGFSQSYTYFIWRNTKQELTEYLTELSSPPVSEFFRPHFFVNTPDINPYFLQTSGRAGFLIRAALAATLSGLWGIYSGFELCEADALPGREEYLNSEKYEIKPRDWNAPGNIISEIAALNRLRGFEPALQSHMGLTFYNAFNEQIIYYGKRAKGHRDMILVAVNLDPHRAQEADFELPLWEWNLADDGALDIEDLVSGGHWTLRGKMQHIRLTPDLPYAIWRAAPARET